MKIEHFEDIEAWREVKQTAEPWYLSRDYFKPVTSEQ
jgi:hypothetical protein